MRVRWQAGGLAALMALLPVAASVSSQPALVQAQVQIVREAGAKSSGDSSNAVLWLVPLDESSEARRNAGPPPKLEQKNKSFVPHVLVVQVGALVQFPNRDPFFHNVFSLFNGRRFDLGLYEAGSSRSIRFDRPGISYLFCNIHPEMSAVVIAVPTPFFGLSGRDGRIRVPDVPPGRYKLNVWYERALPEELERLSRVVAVPEDTRDLRAIRIVEKVALVAHKNKYGQDYEPPQPTSPAYAPP